MICAFYDVDGTILKINSMMSFFDYWSNKNELIKLRNSFYIEYKRLIDAQSSREVMNRRYYEYFKGFSESEMISEGLLWFNIEILNKDVFFKKVVESMSKHKSEGHKIVFVSGSMLPLLNPIGQLLHADDILCVKQIKDENGILTGDIGGIQTIGAGKKEAILAYANNYSVDLESSYAYGDDISDMPMMECVGNAICVGNESTLSYCFANIKNKTWEVITV